MTELTNTQTHASFRLDMRIPLQLSTDSDLYDVWQGLSYRIMRKPNDLIAHTRRIRLCHTPCLRDRLAGALLDLDHVLNGNGAALRQRLHAESLAALGDEAHLLEAPQDRAVKGQILPSMRQLLRSDTSGAPTALS